MSEKNAANQEMEIDLIALVKLVWEKKTFVFKVVGVAILIGLVIAFSKPKYYTSSVIFTTETSQGMSGNMGMLASFAGINNSLMNTESISPELYPDVLKSSVFIQNLFDIRVEDKKLEIDTTLYHYLLNDQKKAWYSYVIGAPFQLLSLFSSKDKGEESALNDSRYISKDDMDTMMAIGDAYNINVDKKTNLVTFTITTQSPVISAYLADTITSRLQDYIIQFKIKKSQSDLENAELLFQQAKNEYDKALSAVAEFTDKNKNIVSAQYAIKEKELQNELNLTYSVYTQMAQQVQVCKVKIQDQKPVFSIIQPAFEPLQPSSPNKKLILIGFAFLGFVGASLWVLRKELMGMFIKSE